MIRQMLRASVSVRVLNSARALTVDLRSDTVTQPSKKMREAVLWCPVGDDVYGEDPTVTALEKYAANLTGMEQALFVPTGCMGNLCAMAAHCQRGDEIILGDKSHIYNYEGGSPGVCLGLSTRAVSNCSRGRVSFDHVAAAVRPDDPHYPKTTLLCLENTHNIAGGRVLDADYLQEASAICKHHGLKFHIDGARIANAAVAQGVSIYDLTHMADSVSICLSKGLGAPAGSVLAGSDEMIYHARRARKLFGGGMRQIGFLAVAAHIALVENVDRLADDHKNAQDFASIIKTSKFLEVSDVESNMVVFRPVGIKISPAELVVRLERLGIRTGLGYSTENIRAVFHLGVSKTEMLVAASALVNTLALV